MEEKLTFTGHDKFRCRQFWLKKGLTHIENNRTFNDSAVVDLGVGRNMVSSIRYWVRAFGISVGNKSSEFGSKLLADDGFDPYIEDIGTVWLLHYNLVTQKVASLYNIVFNDFLRTKIEFTKKDLHKYLVEYCEKHKYNANPSSLKHDIDVFINNYALPEKNKGIEADFSGLLYELKLLTRIERSGDWFKIENTDRVSLAPQIVLFCILRTAEKRTTTFSFRDLLQKENSVGRVFSLSANGLNDKLQQMTELYPNKLVFSENAGIKVLQIREELNCWDILKDYYEN